MKPLILTPRNQAVLHYRTFAESIFGNLAVSRSNRSVTALFSHELNRTKEFEAAMLDKSMPALAKFDLVETEIASAIKSGTVGAVVEINSALKDCQIALHGTQSHADILVGSELAGGSGHSFSIEVVPEPERSADSPNPQIVIPRLILSIGTPPFPLIKDPFEAFAVLARQTADAVYKLVKYSTYYIPQEKRKETAIAVETAKTPS